MKKILFTFLIVHLSFTIANSQSGWVQQNSGTGFNLNSVFFLNDNTGYAVGDSVSGSLTFHIILKTSDGGLNWIKQSQNPPANIYALKSIFFLNPDTGFACGGGIFSTVQYVVKTINGGTTWNTLFFNNENYAMQSIWFINELTGIAVGRSPITACIFRTSNGGLNWSNLNMIPPNGAVWSVNFTNNFTGYACSDTAIFKTTNGGINWTGQPFLAGFRAISFINDLTGWVTSSSHVYRTTNSGINWSSFFNTLNYVYNDIKFVNLQTGWICGSGIYRSTNGGVNWTQQSSVIGINSLSFVSETTGWAVGSNGKILKTTTGGLMWIQPVSNEIPNSFSLSQNYPNPFNPKTIINFQLPTFNHVSLKIYDVTGSEIATLVNDKLSPGIYEIEFDGSNYSSGVYFYTLSAGSYIETIKMVLLK